MLTRLAARARNSEHTLAPRVRGLFEPAAPANEGFQEVVEDIETFAPPSAPAPSTDRPPAASPSRAPRRELPHQESDHAVAQPARDAKKPDRLSPSGDVRTDTTSSPSVSTTTVHSERHVQNTERIRERTVETPHIHVHEARRDQSDATAAAPTDVARAPEPGAPPLRTPDVEVRRERVVPEPLPVAAAPTARPSPDQDAPRQDDVAQSPGHTVHIHVDRLEVRHVPVAHRRASARRPVANPGPDLNDYLRGKKA